MCTSAAMMAGGRLVAHDRIEHLLAPTGRVIIDTPRPDEALTVLASITRLDGVQRAGGRLTLQLNGLPPESMNDALVRGGVPVRELIVERHTLEDAYLGLTGTSGDARR
jgi:hypothetical protein